MKQAHDHPQTIDRYKIREVLGTGAMGSVYGAWDPKLQRQVAIKVVPEYLKIKGKSRERFEREARALATIKHPNIVALYDYSGADAEALYVVIEKLEGEDLYAALYRRGKMSENIAAAIGHDLCLALEAAHAAGLIHRDLKPENVFLDQGGRVVLTDFGIVKAVRDDTTVQGYREVTEVIGTPGFMAPEQMRGKTLGPSVDIYALGALLYNIVTQRMPFVGHTPLAIFHAAQQGQYEDPRKYSPHLSEEFCVIIRRCLQPLPGRRPASALDVRLALKSILEEAGVTEVRDDLVAYMSNPEQARRDALTRSIAIQTQKFKLANIDHDQRALGRARARLLTLAPKHPALRMFSTTPDLDSAWDASSAPLRDRGAKLFACGAAGLHRLRATMHRCHAGGLPTWVFASCLFVAVGLLGLGLLVDATRHVPAKLMAHSAAVAGVAPRLIRHLPQVEDNPSGLPALLRAPHPHFPGPYPAMAAMSPKNALLDISMAQGLHLLLDGKRLTHRIYSHLRLKPGPHTVDYVSAQGYHVRRVFVARAGERINLKVDAHRHAEQHRRG